MPKTKILVVYVALMVATLLAFWGVTGADFIHFDDRTYVAENSHIQGGITLDDFKWAFTTFHAANWHPVTWISHMLDVQFFGLNPHAHHGVNLLFHLANTALLFFVLHRMTKALWRSAFVAALFALHPLHVESVAWVAERKDLLSTFFLLLTLCTYALYTERRRTSRYLAVLLSYGLGLLAKPMLVTLPFVLVLLDYWPLGRFESKPGKFLLPDRQKSGKKHTKKAAPPEEQPESWRAALGRLLLEKIPLFVLALVSSVVTFLAQRQGGAVQPIENLSLSLRIENALISYCVYIGKMLWPTHLAFFYPYQKSWAVWQVSGAVLFLLAITALVLRSAKSCRYALVGWFWYIGTLVPVIGLIQVGDQAQADRYTYIPLIGLFIIAAWFFPELFKKWRYRNQALVLLAAGILLACFGSTRMQVRHWQNSFTLSEHALNVTGNNAFVYHFRGNAYAAQGNYKQAIKDYDRAIQIKPGWAQPYTNRGSAYESMGNPTQAIEDYDRAIAIAPKAALTFYNRGNARIATGGYRQAIKDYDRAIEINPNYGLAYINRGNVYTAMGNPTQAVKDYDNAIAIDPQTALAFYNRGNAHAAMGSYEQAIKDYDRAIEINPRYASAYRGRAISYGGLGNKKQAYEDLRAAAALGDKAVQNYLRAHGAGI
jgi:protein O-mannosyl-transferase